MLRRFMKDPQRLHREKSFIIQVALSGLLLADHARCREVCNEMRCLPKECQCSASLGDIDHSYMRPIAFYTTKDWHHWPISFSFRAMQVLLAVNYTRWVEVEQATCIAKLKAIDFVWRAIFCRFDIPRVLIVDNGWQFVGIRFEEFCEDQGILHRLTSVVHP